jgi:hypothetical protein
MTSTLTDSDPIPLPAGDLVFGITLRVPSRHIVTHDSAQRAIDAAGNVTDAAPTALCGHSVRLATKWGAYDPDSLYRRTSFCHECAWIVALHHGTIDTEIASYIVDDVDAAAITAAGVDATVGPRILAAIANDTAVSSGRDLAPSHRSTMLARASRHLPVVSMCEECNDAGAAQCPHHVVYCPGCTPTAGEWAGEWEDTLLQECIVAAPCSVQTILAAHYEIHGPASSEGRAITPRQPAS